MMIRWWHQFTIAPCVYSILFRRRNRRRWFRMIAVSCGCPPDGDKRANKCFNNIILLLAIAILTEAAASWLVFLVNVGVEAGCHVLCIDYTSVPCLEVFIKLITMLCYLFPNELSRRQRSTTWNDSIVSIGTSPRRVMCLEKINL